MSNQESSNVSSAEPREQEAVRTTIVGGRPPGSGKSIGDIPRGIEILMKKAAVDPKFRKLLLENPKKAAEQIELQLDATELAMLQSAPKEQLNQIIDQTEVPFHVRRNLLKATTAVAILGVLAGVGIYAGGKIIDRIDNAGRGIEGIRPDNPSAGIRPDDIEREDDLTEQQ